MNRLIVHSNRKKGTINRNIYGHFAEHLGRCIYEGLWVGDDSPIPNVRGIRSDTVEALRAIDIPVLRWPGGCFADEYHWKDGIGPRKTRKRMINTHWGGVIENNHFGTHEFMDLCDQLGCEPYICGNVGSGTVQEMSEWIEYITFQGESPMADLRAVNGREEPWKLRYFGVGNESWGCGGSMRPEYYADLYRRYQTYARNYGSNRLYRIACGPNSEDYRWTDVLMKEAFWCMDGLSLHYYTISSDNWDDKGSATGFSEAEWFRSMKNALRIEEMITRHSEIMDIYDPKRNVGLIIDEWGMWHKAEPGTNPRFLYQQNTIRDALVAGLNLNIFNSHCDRVQMANIAQTVNVLQSMILTEGAKMLLTPTYHVFEMYKVHQGAHLLESELECSDYCLDSNAIPSISSSASIDAKGVINITLCNLNASTDIDINIDIPDISFPKASGRLLTSLQLDAHNTFEEPELVKPVEYTDFNIVEGRIGCRLPKASVIRISIMESQGFAS